MSRRRSFQERTVFRRLITRQITRVVRDRYGTTLPDDDAGRDDLALMLGYLTHMPHGTLKAENFVDLWAPWCALEDRQLALREAALSPPPRLTADQLAQRLGVTMAQRSRLALTVIGAVDCDKESRAALRRERKRHRDRERMADKRRAMGAKLRDEYEATSLSRTKPWELEGIGRRQWERRRRRDTAVQEPKHDASPSPTMIIINAERHTCVTGCGTAAGNPTRRGAGRRTIDRDVVSALRRGVALTGKPTAVRGTRAKGPKRGARK